MRVLFFGDIVGRTARNDVIEQLPLLRDEFGLDFIVVNCEMRLAGLESRRKSVMSFLPLVPMF